jgi:hypothetical protein
MKKYLIYLIITGLIGIVVLAAIPIRNYYLFLKEPISPLTNAIPEETVLLVKAGSLNQFIKILTSSDLFVLLENNKTGPGVHAIVDQVAGINEKSSYFKEITKQNEVIVCLVPDKELNPQMLLLTVIGKTKPETIRQQIRGILSHEFMIQKINDSLTDLYCISNNTFEAWFYVHKGILALAFNRETLEQSYNALSQEKNLTNNRPFLRLSETSGKRVDGVMMINNRKLIETIFQTTEDNPLNFSGSPFNGWTSLDLLIEKSRILMDGFMVGQQDTTIFENQEPGKINNIELLPFGTAFAISLSITDQQTYTAAFMDKDTLHIAGYDSANQTASFEIFRREEHLRSWIGNSLSFAAMPRFFAGDKSAGMILIELKNADSASSLLKPYLQPYQGNIKIFTAPTLFQRLWGNLFATNGRQFCLMTDRMLVISPSLQLLEEYRMQTSENRLFGKSPTFRSATALMMEKSNITIIAIPSICNQYFKRNIRGIDSRKSQKWTGVPASTDLLCLQVNAGNPLLYTHAFALIKSAKNSQDIADQDKPLLPVASKTEEPESELPGDQTAIKKEKISSGSVIGKLFLIPDPKSGKNQILTFNKNTIQAHSENGNKLWSFVCKEAPAGGVYAIGLNQQKEKYFLVVAGKLLHIIDQNGREFKNSPVKLPGESTGNMAVFDYDRTKEYRLIYQGKDNSMYNVTIDGKELTGWQKPRLNNSLSGPPQFFRTGGKDYLVFADNRGKIIITDRRGRNRIKIDDGFRKSNGAEIFENRTNNKGIFLTASANGNLAYIDINGRTSESRFGDFGQNPWFGYRDFNGDGDNDFIFCGNGRIEVFTKMKKTIASGYLPGAGFSKPYIYSSPKQSWLAIRDQKSGKVLIFNSKNQLFKNATILSDTDPVILLNEGEKKPSLLTTLDGKLIFTLLEK